MQRKRVSYQYGFTIVELAIAAVASIIVILGLSVVLADSLKGWQKMYDRTFSDVVTGSYVAQKTFDSRVRQASKNNLSIDVDGGWAEVQYYAGDDSTVLDCYARFYRSGDELNVEYGQLNPKETLSVQTICSNVANCVFRKNGRAIQMILTLNNGSQTSTVVSSAFLHND